MPSRTTTALLLAVALFACGAADKEKAGEKAGEKAKAGDKDKAGEKAKAGDKDKAAGKKDAAKKDEKPACMHCGGTCCLVPICVCEPGTKKKPQVEFEVKCEPMCVAGCGSKPWPFGQCHDRVGCTSCCEEPCRCPGWVRSRKMLKKETVDEEVPTIKRKVAYVCDTCAGRGTGCCGDRCDHRQAGWWTHLTWWWPRKPAD